MSSVKGMLSVLFFSFIFMFLASPTIFANENLDLINIDPNTSESVVVSEEQVIQDFMQNEGVDRETAMQELGVTSSGVQGNVYDTNASCTLRWEYFTSKKKLVDVISNTYLTLRPYAQVRTCNYVRSFASVSTSVNYTVNSTFNLSTVVVQSPHAGLNGSSSMSVAAIGYIRNTFGIRLRNWSYSDTVYPQRTFSGGGAKF